MYDFEPTEEQQMLVDAIKKFAANDIRKAAHDAEEEAMLPEALVNKGWEMGILQASIPEKYGGFGDRSAVTSVLAIEEMCWGDMAITFGVMVPGLFALPVLIAGSEEQKQAYLPEIAEGPWVPYSSAMIEPYFDYDPLAMRTRVVEENGVYLLNGEKVYVPYAGKAPKILVYADFNGKTQGFIVDAGTPGVEVKERMKLLGVNGLPVYRVVFKDVHVPRENRLGGEAGHEIGPILDASRVALAAAAVGLSRAALEYSMAYAKDREVFGVKVAQKQAIAFMLAEMATEIEAIRLLTWEAAWMIDEKKPDAAKMAYLALSGATDMAMMVTDRAVQILGGHGYIREHPVEHWMRNGRGIATLTGLVMA